MCVFSQQRKPNDHSVIWPLPSFCPFYRRLWSFFLMLLSIRSCLDHDDYHSPVMLKTSSQPSSTHKWRSSLFFVSKGKHSNILSNLLVTLDPNPKSIGFAVSLNIQSLLGFFFTSSTHHVSIWVNQHPSKLIFSNKTVSCSIFQSLSLSLFLPTFPDQNYLLFWSLLT